MLSSRQRKCMVCSDIKSKKELYKLKSVSLKSEHKGNSIIYLISLYIIKLFSWKAVTNHAQWTVARHKKNKLHVTISI